MFNVEQNIRHNACRHPPADLPDIDIVMVDDGLEWTGVDRDGLRRQRSTHLFYLNEQGAGETRGA